MKNILTKLNKVMSEVGYIQKDKKNSLQNYTYLSEAGIKEKIQPLLVKNGIVFSVSMQRADTVVSGTTKSGATTFRTDIELKYRFMDCESGEILEGIVMGSGSDTGDKGVYKAITGAIKYALTSTFLVPTGDDAEIDHHETENVSRETKAATVEDAKEILGDETPFQAATRMILECTSNEALKKVHDKIMSSKKFSEEDKKNLLSVVSEKDGFLNR